MRKTLLVAALFLGFSATGFSQFVTTDNLAGGIIMDKNQVTSSEHIYTLKDANTGLHYESVPSNISFTVGDQVIFKMVVPDDIIYVVVPDDIIYIKRGSENKNGVRIYWRIKEI